MLVIRDWFNILEKKIEHFEKTYSIFLKKWRSNILQILADILPMLD